jgi:hypothetical protein
MLKALFRFTCAVGGFLFLLLNPQKISAQALFVLKDVQQQYRLDKNISVFIDTTNRLTIDDVRIQNFSRSTGNLTFGYLKHSIWLKVQTKNNVPGAKWFLEIPAPFLEYVRFLSTKS